MKTDRCAVSARAAALLIGTFALCLSCESISMRKMGDKPTVSEKNAVIAYRIHARTATLKLEGSPYLIVERVDGKPRIANSGNVIANDESLDANNTSKVDFWSGRATKEAWKDEAGARTFDDLVVAEAVPGTYHLKEIHQFLSENSYTAGTTKTTVTRWLSIKLDYAISLKAGDRFDLGTFEVDMEAAKEGGYNYSYSIDAAPTRQAEDSAALSKLYPGLIPPDGLAPARLLMYNDLQQEITNKEPVNYIRKKADDGSIQALATEWGPRVPAGTSFSLEWSAMWKEGSADKSFGMYIGHDPNNALLFGITDDGRAVAQRLASGAYEKPLLDARSDAIHPGNTRLRNLCRVDLSNGSGRFYVNDALVGEFPCDTDYPNGICGYYAFGAGIFDFARPRLMEIAR
jgi:hypothetical protein